MNRYATYRTDMMAKCYKLDMQAAEARMRGNYELEELLLEAAEETAGEAREAEHMMEVTNARY